MRAEEKTHIQNSIGRAVISAASFIVQVWWIFLLAKRLTHYSTAISTFSSVAAIAVAIYIYNRSDTPSEFKMPWIMLILAFPIAGIFIYFMLGHKKAAQKLRNRMDQLHEDYLAFIHSKKEIIDEIAMDDLGIANQNRYLLEKEGFPVYRNEQINFYSDAEKAYENMLKDLRAAKKYIFMEYHTIQYGIAFEKILAILKLKVREGVEVRVFYDDVGSIGFLNGKFARRLNEMGIKCRAFNRVSPAFRLYMNNRDHRKITVIDGKIAYTGGYNLADEYFHITDPYGHWNDTGIRFTGPAVDSILRTFFEIWNFTKKEPEDVSKYFIEHEPVEKGGGYVQPYSDNPLNDSQVGENVFLNMIKNAKKTLFLSTPYLVPGDTMIRELNMAAARGVDVRIVTPGIPDKRIIYNITRSYYGQFLKSGVKIYEYTPGFIHGKQMVADGEIATVGTINMDYRSLYHHFENAVLMYKTNAVNNINNYFKDLFLVSSEIDGDRKRLLIFRICDSILRLIAPLF